MSTNFQEIYFNPLWRFDYYSNNTSFDEKTIDLLKRNNNVHVMILNRVSQYTHWKDFCKKFPVTVLYESPLAVNKNYGPAPRNLCIVWEFCQPDTENSKSTKETKGTVPAQNVGSREKIPQATTSSPSLTEEVIASHAAIINQVEPPEISEWIETTYESW